MVPKTCVFGLFEALWSRNHILHADIAPGSHANAFEGSPHVPNAFEERQPSVFARNRTADCVLGVDAS